MDGCGLTVFLVDRLDQLFSSFSPQLAFLFSPTHSILVQTKGDNAMGERRALGQPQSLSKVE